jgi:hypothetical protein
VIDTLANVKTALLVTGTTDDALLNRLMDRGGRVHRRPGHRARLRRRHVHRDAPGRARRAVPPQLPRHRRDQREGRSGAAVRRRHRARRGHLRAARRPRADRVAHRAVPHPARRVRDDWPAAVQVVYATATGAVPAPVQEAFGQLVGHWYRQAKTFADQEYQMLLERTSGTDAKVWSWSLASGLKIPPGVTGVARAVPRAAGVRLVLLSWDRPLACQSFDRPAACPT